MKSIIEENGFKICEQGKSLVITAQLGNVWKSCTLSPEQVTILKTTLRSFGLDSQLMGFKSKLKRILLNQEMRPSKAMFDVDPKRAENMVHIQESLAQLYELLCKYEKTNNNKKPKYKLNDKY